MLGKSRLHPPGHNFRSLGGLPAAGGVIREGAVYRSARLTRITEPETHTFKELDLRTIVDFRTRLEQMLQHPDSPTVADAVPLKLSVSMSARLPSRKYYCRLLSVDQHRKPIKKFFDIMADPASYPVLYHCSVGCDRTGIATALLLSLAGTPREDILQDYMASGKVGKVRARRLNEVFVAVDRAGGIENFLLAHGVSTEQQAAVRANIIQKASGG